MSHNPPRPTMLRSLAERAALHPRMEDAVAGAVISAVRATLPGIIEMLVADMADPETGTLRLRKRKVPDDMRRMRDDRVRALLAAGMAPELVALEVGCSRRHVYNVRRVSARLCKTLP